MKSFALICLLYVLVVKADPFTNVIFEEWKTFQMEFGKNYTDATEKYFRMNIFVENREKIAKHNQLYAQGLVTYKMGINQFTDMLEHEFIEQYTGFYPLLGDTANETLSAAATFIPPENVRLPDTVDWRHNGAVTPVKDQGQCGSCWAFSTTGALEGQHFRQTGQLVSLSEQNLMDCSRSFDNHGCQGGLPARAFMYIIRNGGIDTEVSYPYQAIDRSQCFFNRANVGSTEKNFVLIQSRDENALLNAVGSVGPISVAIHVGQSFMNYRGGVYYDPGCSQDALNHAVLIVGYGVEGNVPYWLVKNSWSTRWGEGGYIKMARNRNNNCGIATMATYPLV